MKDEVDVIISNSISWDCDINVDDDIDRYIDGGLNSGVNFEVERDGDEYL